MLVSQKQGVIIMFLLKQLPEKKLLKKLAKESKDIDPTRAVFSLQFLRTASDALISIDKFFASKGLSHGRFLALMVLGDAGDAGLFPFEIADHMGVSRATASGLIKGLESAGYVASSQSKTDGRMKKILITDTGADFLEALTPEYYSFISRFTGTTEKKILKNFTAVLSDISDNVKNIYQ